MPISGSFESKGPKGASRLPLPAQGPAKGSNKLRGSSSHPKCANKDCSLPPQCTLSPYLACHHDPHVGQELRITVSHHRHNGQLQGSRHKG